MRIRKPYVAGMFYEANPELLKRQIEECFLHRLGPGKLPEKAKKYEVFGLIVPHAGYMYSGPVAAHAYYVLSQARKSKYFIIIGPNHSGMGSPIAVASEDAWEMPFGKVKVNIDYARCISARSGIASIDSRAHLYEHSVEVQIPFLQFLYGSDFEIIPVTMLLQNYEASRRVGEALAECISEYGDAVVIASTDFTHYESAENAHRKDKLAIERILELDSRGLYDVVIENEITMCGYGPVIVLIEAAKKLGYTNIKILKYATSGDITGDYSSVVAYASFVIFKSE